MPLFQHAGVYPVSCHFYPCHAFIIWYLFPLCKWFRYKRDDSWYARVAMCDARAGYSSEGKRFTIFGHTRQKEGSVLYVPLYYLFAYWITIFVTSACSYRYGLYSPSYHLRLYEKTTTKLLAPRKGFVICTVPRRALSCSHSTLIVSHSVYVNITVRARMEI